MKRNYSLLAAIVLILSILIIVDRLLTVPNIQIILENGRAVPLEGASYFSINDVLILIICAWIGGMAFIYLLTITTTPPSKLTAPPEVIKPGGIKPEEIALDILDGDEKIIYAEIVGSGNGILQRDLVLKTGFSEAKVSRLLDKLERRQLIIRRRHGMGNLIMLKK
ncbi:MAG: hypothetical protein QXJ68_03820 [Methanocellales archaeon]